MRFPKVYLYSVPMGLALWGLIILMIYGLIQLIGG